MTDEGGKNVSEQSRTPISNNVKEKEPDIEGSSIIFNEYSHDALRAIYDKSGESNIDDLKWQITSIQVYSVKGIRVFDANYGSNLSRLDSGVVMMFYEALENFASQNLSTRLIDFKVGYERIIFKLSNNHLYLVTVNSGRKVRSGLSSLPFVTVSNLITDISSNLFFLIDDKSGVTENISKELTKLVHEVNENAVVPESSLLELSSLNITQVVISDESGMPVLTRTYDGSNFKDDPMLFSMFLHALNVFFNLNFAEELREINFGNSRLYVKNFGGKFYAIMVQFDNFINVREDSPIHFISYNVLDKINDLVTNLGEDLDIIPEESLGQMIDNFIFKAQLHLDEDYSEAIKGRHK